MSIFAPGSSAGWSMPPRPRPRSHWLIRALTWGVAGLVLAAVLWRFPLVRLKRLDTTAAVASGFDPRSEAARFWSADLEPAFTGAADVRETLARISRDPSEACRAVGRSVGLSRSCLYLVRGRGTIVEVGPAACRVTLDGDPDAAGTPLLGGTLVPDRLDRAVLHRLVALGQLLGGLRLLVDIAVTTIVIALEIRRSGFAAQIAVDALVIHEKFSLNVVAVFVCYVCHINLMN